MNRFFAKRIFTPETFLRDLGFLLAHVPAMIAALRQQEISRAFIEKIMMVTTAVNGCTYCTWFHAKQAAACGISDQEIKNMLELQFHADATDFELPGLLYAQHYAETNRNPDPKMTSRLFNFYGKKSARRILLFIRMINFGNLLGNTWDAVLSRFRGRPAENSPVLFEALFFLFTAPFMLPAMGLAKETRRNRRGSFTNDPIRERRRI
ncbi:carboxymuconolactone decarboxylase family protein [candidate division KSB1 bacterium]|nr:carboxymuconolactone decarboxylase family protein [candidate division KSB1 bacterium]